MVFRQCFSLVVCNPSKTEIVHFSSRFANVGGDLETVTINRTVVTPVSSARNLRVIHDKFLNFSSHINVICKSASLTILAG